MEIIIDHKRLRHNEATKRWRFKNREKQKALSTAWAKDHPERMAELRKFSRAKNLQKRLETDRRAKRETKQFINSLKNKPCVDCNQMFPAYVMDFDHRPNEQKLFNVSNPKTTNRETILAEIAKCDLVCANCHRIRTYDRLENKYGLIGISV